jgi:3-deoxy-7-phosphoheptulonate synthase
LKNHNNQPLVVHSIAEQLASTDPTSKAKYITGVMIESHINAGRQDVPSTGPQDLKHGVSITDACVDWQTTVKMLDELNEAVAKRREALIANGLQGTVNGSS